MSKYVTSSNLINVQFANRKIAMYIKCISLKVKITKLRVNWIALTTNIIFIH